MDDLAEGSSLLREQLCDSDETSEELEDIGGTGRRKPLPPPTPIPPPLPLLLPPIAWPAGPSSPGLSMQARRRFFLSNLLRTLECEGDVSEELALDRLFGLLAPAPPLPLLPGPTREPTEEALLPMRAEPPR